jgi:alkylation response protein AidB-like acyl-CoA dehydrogenase
MIGFDLSEDQVRYREAAVAFADARIKPFAADLDRRRAGDFDWGIVRRFAENNFLALIIPETYGGLGQDVLTSAIIAEEIGAACAGITTVAGGAWLATACLLLVGNERQKEKYFPLLCGPDAGLAALAATEPDAGSDIGSIRTKAVRKGDRYILNGTKAFITNAGLGRFYIVFASTDAKKRQGGLNAFIVDGDAKGLSLGRVEDKMGLRASQTGELIFEDVEIPEENLLGKENAGFLIAMQTLDATRPCLGAIAVGLARAAYEAALAYARERKQFGRPIIDNQGISFMLADMAMEIDAARLMTWRASWLVDQGMDNTRAASMCKIFATEMAERVCSRAMQIYGACGYTRDYPLEKYLRDAKALPIYEGTNQIQRIIVGSML